jgi:hypothetical protein
MGLRYNPFNGSFDFTRSPGSYLDGEVQTFADLPLDTAAAPLNSAWLVREASGLYFLTRKPAGIYIRTATGGTDRNADYTYASAFPDVFSDANFTVYDDADSTRSMQIQVTDNETLTFKVTGSDSIVRSVAFPLSAILLAALMSASSALAQNIGIVTGTNGTVITGRTNTLTFTNPATFSGTLTATGNVTMSGTANTAPLQTAASGSSLMTRELSDARYSFSRWYGANEILSGAQIVGANPLAQGNGLGDIVSATMVTVSNVNTKFMLPVDYRVSGSVKVVSYWTDRILTNSGTNGDIAVWTLPFVVQPVSNTQTNGYVGGTQIKSTFTANYGGNPNFRYYVMEQTVNLATVTNISATNPMQLKWVELQRRGADATDTSSDNIFLSGVYIYVP